MSTQKRLGGISAGALLACAFVVGEAHARQGSTGSGGGGAGGAQPDYGGIALEGGGCAFDAPGAGAGGLAAIVLALAIVAARRRR